MTSDSHICMGLRGMSIPIVHIVVHCMERFMYLWQKTCLKNEIFTKDYIITPTHSPINISYMITPIDQYPVCLYECVRI